MDYKEAYEILHPDTTRQKLAEIEYYGGFAGQQKAIEAVNEACVVACEAILELQLYKENKLCLVPEDVYGKQCTELDEYKQLGTLEEVREAVERLQPKAPNWHMNPVMEHGKLPVCPTCNTIMVRTEILGRTIDEHCVTCGQAIDWSVSE